MWKLVVPATLSNRITFVSFWPLSQQDGLCHFFIKLGMSLLPRGLSVSWARGVCSSINHLLRLVILVINIILTYRKVYFNSIIDLQWHLSCTRWIEAFHFIMRVQYRTSLFLKFWHNFATVIPLNHFVHHETSQLYWYKPCIKHGAFTV